MFFLMITSANAYEFPPYQGVTLKVLGDITGNYNSNVTFASDKDNKIEDFRTMLNLGLDFQYIGKRRSMDFYGIIRRQIYQTSSDIQNPSENLKVSYSEELTKYDVINLQNSFAHTQEPGTVTGDFNIEECRNYFEYSGLTASEIESKCNEFEEEFGRFTGRFDSYRNEISFSYIRQISKAFTLRTNYNYVKNWSDAVGTNDSDSNIFRLTSGYIHSEATSFSLSYNYQMSNFDRGNDISSQSINAGIGQSITKNLYLDVNVGKIKVSDGSDSVSAEATLRGELDEKTSASLSYSQGVQLNANTDDTFKNWQATGSLSEILLEDLQGSLSAFYGKGDYSSTNISDTLLGTSILVSYNFWQGKRGSSMKGSLGYSYSNLDSSDEGRGYTRNLINASLTVAF